MPRARGTRDGRTELDVLLEQLLEPDDRDLHDPEVVLRRLGRGDLTDAERQEVRERAEGALRHIAREDHLEALGAIATSPAIARTAMGAKRAADRTAWAAALEAIEQP